MELPGPLESALQNTMNVHRYMVYTGNLPHVIPEKLK